MAWDSSNESKQMKSSSLSARMPVWLYQSERSPSRMICAGGGGGGDDGEGSALVSWVLAQPERAKRSDRVSLVIMWKDRRGMSLE